ncbi:MAG: PDZ domain-containing protein, partial [Flavobacteriales bacterium]
IEVGEWVLAVGNPFNLTSTVTAGIVSAKARGINLIGRNSSSELPPLESFIQTDAAVNPGNSGGALVNAKGELIGINTAIASNTGSYAGHSFAVPVNLVKKVAKDLMEYGKVQRAFLGVRIRNINESLKEKKELGTLNGVFVAQLTENGAAEEAGIRAGDVITKVGSVKVDNVPQLQEQIGELRPGDKVTVTLIRGEEKITKEVTLRNIKGTTKVTTKETSKTLDKLGATMRKVNDKEKNKLNIEYGVKVTELYSGKLRSAGVKEKFIIRKVNNRKVNSVDELVEAIEEQKGGVLIEGVYPNGMKAYYGFGA